MLALLWFISLLFRSRRIAKTTTYHYEVEGNDRIN